MEGDGLCAEWCAGGEHLITRSASRFWLVAKRDGLKFVPMLLFLCLTFSCFFLFDTEVGVWYIKSIQLKSNKLSFLCYSTGLGTIGFFVKQQ